MNAAEWVRGNSLAIIPNEQQTDAWIKVVSSSDVSEVIKLLLQAGAFSLEVQIQRAWSTTLLSHVWYKWGVCLNDSFAKRKAGKAIDPSLQRMPVQGCISLWEERRWRWLPVGGFKSEQLTMNWREFRNSPYRSQSERSTCNQLLDHITQRKAAHTPSRAKVKTFVIIM